MDKSRIRVDIMGRGFNIVSGEKADYLKRVAAEVDERMRKLKEENPKLNYDTAAVLTSLNLCDELFIERDGGQTEEEIEEESDNIRSQLVEYSRELSKAANTIKRLEKEIDKIKKESREKEEKMSKEYAAKEKEMLDMLEAL